MGSLSGWWLGLIAALLACAAAAGLEMRALSIEERLDGIEARPVARPAPPPAVRPAEPAPEPAPAAIPEATPPEVRALETRIDALETQADEAGLPDPDPAGRLGRRSVLVVAPSAAPAPSPTGGIIDPRLRQAARERAEREIAKDREKLAEKRHAESEQKRQEMLQQFEMMKKMFGPERAPRVAEKLMKQLGIAPEHRELVENAVRSMGAALSTAFDDAKAKIQTMPEVTDEAMQTVFATQFGMAYMGALTNAAKQIKQVVPPDQAKEIGQAIQQAIQPDPEEMQGMTGAGAGEAPSDGSESPPPPEPVEEGPPK